MYSIYADLRDRYGLSDYAVAKGAGVGRSTLSDWKTGKHIPNRENMKKIADFFHVSIDYLMTGEIPSLKKPETPPDKATELYEKYLKASPEVQKAVELLLKAEQ
jgi:transcriptional regulator with XRE-family HTH domain